MFLIALKTLAVLAFLLMWVSIVCHWTGHDPFLEEICGVALDRPVISRRHDLEHVGRPRLLATKPLWEPGLFSLHLVQAHSISYPHLCCSTPRHSVFPAYHDPLAARTIG
jgi:hypothetical protein